VARVTSNLTPELYVNLKKIGGTIIPENEEKLRLAREENRVLRKVYGYKVSEKDKVHYKYSKVQSQYLDVMRELNRYRSDFAECFSMKSKLIQTENMSQDIEKLIELNSDLLD